MSRMMYLSLAALSCMGVGLTGLWADGGASHGPCDATGSSCLTSTCNGAVLISNAGNAPNPQPVGCTQNGTACAGVCYRCQLAENKQFCKYTGNVNDTCSYLWPALRDCGTRNKYGPCGGLWATICTCPAAGGVPDPGACMFNECVAP
jgi:hypothetical protein